MPTISVDKYKLYEALGRKYVTFISRSTAKNMPWDISPPSIPDL